MSERRFPPPWTVEELDACFGRSGRPKEKRPRQGAAKFTRFASAQGREGRTITFSVR